MSYFCRIKLVSSDGQTFTVNQKVAKMSRIIDSMLETLGNKEDEPIPILNVTGDTLGRVIQWCNRHQNEVVANYESRANRSDICHWDREFLNHIELQVLNDLILAANYLDIPGLLDVTCKTVANMIKGKSPEEIRQLFDIVNDLTDEEEKGKQ